jgi:hypothetical protein
MLWYELLDYKGLIVTSCCGCTLVLQLRVIRHWMLLCTGVFCSKRQRESSGGDTLARDRQGKRLCPDTCCGNAGRPATYCYEHGGGSLCPVDCLENKTDKRTKALCLTHGGSKLCPLSCIANGGNLNQYCAIHSGSSLCLITCLLNAREDKRNCNIHGTAYRCPLESSLDCLNNPGKPKAICHLQVGGMSNGSNGSNT